MTKRIRLRRKKGWRLPEGAVNVARPGKWGNPFRVGRRATAAECVGHHRNLLSGFLCMSYGPPAKEQQAHLDMVIRDIAELRGKDLACWCALDKPCHADALLELARRVGSDVSLAAGADRNE